MRERQCNKKIKQVSPYYKLTAIDIELNNGLIIEVKQSGKGMTRQLSIKRDQLNRRGVGYAPGSGPALEKGLAEEGFPLFRDTDSLLEFLNNYNQSEFPNTKSWQ